MPISRASEQYRLVPYTEDQAAEVFAYWRRIEGKSNLRYRICDIPEPTLQDVAEMYADKRSQNFSVFYTPTGQMVAEVMLNNSRGLCSQIHFSIDPEFHGPESLVIGDSGLRDLFNLEDTRTGQCIQALIGLTPMNNKLGIRFKRKLFFKELDIIPKMYYTEYNKDYIDGHLSILTRERFYGREK